MTKIRMMGDDKGVVIYEDLGVSCKGLTKRVFIETIVEGFNKRFHMNQGFNSSDNLHPSQDWDKSEPIMPDRYKLVHKK